LRPESLDVKRDPALELVEDGIIIVQVTGITYILDEQLPRIFELFWKPSGSKTGASTCGCPPGATRTYPLDISVVTKVLLSLKIAPPLVGEGRPHNAGEGYATDAPEPP
jgi:hypothetical protein